jgi:metallo-beta-lactamase family protein
LFVGYQAEGTKGWFLKNRGKDEGALRIFHEPVPVRARIDSIDSLSAHGDQNDLLAWIATATRRPSRIILNHGSGRAAEALAGRIERELGIEALPLR